MTGTISLSTFSIFSNTPAPTRSHGYVMLCRQKKEQIDVSNAIKKRTICLVKHHRWFNGVELTEHHNQRWLSSISIPSQPPRSLKSGQPPYLYTHSHKRQSIPITYSFSWFRSTPTIVEGITFFILSISYFNTGSHHRVLLQCLVTTTTAKSWKHQQTFDLPSIKD